MSKVKRKSQFLQKKLARQLPVELQKEVMHAAREHMIEAKHAEWNIPDGSELLSNATRDQAIGIQRIWFEVTALGSKQGI